MEKKLIGINLISESIKDFFVQLGYNDINCSLGLDFCYWYGYNLIEYPVTYDENSIQGFQEYVKETYADLPKCSLFTLALLHELGHHLTIPQISKKDRKKARKAKKRLENKINNNCTPNKLLLIQKKYCTLKDEKMATAKAINILKNNYSLVDKYDKIIYNNIIAFYKMNNISED